MGSERRLRLFIYARIVVSLFFLTATLLLEYQDSAIDITMVRHQSGVVRLMAFSLLFSFASLFFLKKTSALQFITNLQVIWDLLFVTILVLFTGGIRSPYSYLYLLSIMTAGMLLGRRQSLYAASLCGILYGTIIDFQYFGYLSFLGLSQLDAYQYGSLQLLYTILFNLVAFGLTAFITGLLAERVRLSEEALKKTTIDYSELTRLNSAIVDYSESGLLTTTRNGRIRVFNPYAEVISGLSQAEVYDVNLASIFPQLDLNILSTNLEFQHQAQDNSIMTLGYRVAPFNDANGELIGYIVNFRDITHVRQMESALKRADKLATLGELSARMAHEIRNPLAALCGSVQLLSGSAGIQQHESRLLAIVTREAARLDAIISEFLLYARPSIPQLEPVNLYAYLEEELLFLAQDPHFENITLLNVVPKELTVSIDPNLFNQVMVNLLRNAAEAMIAHGEIVIDSFVSRESVHILVKDNGPGIPPQSLDHLFEPFWTTKPLGTGLGLAISYRIIESHGGNISVESPATGGCIFKISLPAVR